MSGSTGSSARPAPQSTHQEIEALRAGSPHRWGAWREFLKRVAVVRYGLQPDVAADVVQEALAALHLNLGEILEPKALRAFVLRTLQRKVHDRRRPSAAANHRDLRASLRAWFLKRCSPGPRSA